MTLVARAKAPSHHKKTTGKHHRQGKAYHKAYWPYLPVIAVVAVGFLCNNLFPAHHAVLDYATDMSVQSLLDDTNSQRAANSEGALGLNALLDQAAQAKANDMVARDYWSHNTPDGQTPWSFIIAAGYTYQTAGENLAYGFNSAADTLTGWMNSPGHRANILNTTYQEVGFGIANGSNYQNSGPETVIVAMYASPTGSAIAAAAPAAPAAPTPAATTPKTTATSTGQSSQSAAGGSAAAAPAASDPANVPTAADTPTSTPVDTTQLKQTAPVTTQKIAESKAQPVDRIQLLTAGNASWSALLVTIIIAASLALFLVRHGIAWHRVIRKGEKFFLKHPLLDSVIAAIVVIGLLLSRVSGVIK